MRYLCLAVLVTALSIVAASACEDPQQLAGFKTCADVAKAESEGALVVYATDPEAPSEQVLAKFNALFPKIKPTYLRIQAGGLFARLRTERQGNVLSRRHRATLRYEFRARFPEARRIHAVRFARDGGLQGRIQEPARRLPGPGARSPSPRSPIILTW